MIQGSAPGTVAFVVSGVALLSIAGVAYGRYGTPGLPAFCAFVGALGLAGVGGGLLTAVGATGFSAIWVTQLAEVGSIAWLAFALAYTGRGRYVTRRSMGALLATYVFLWLPLGVGLVGTGVGPVLSGVFTVATNRFALVCTLVGGTLVVQTTARHGFLSGWAGVALGTAAIGPWLLTAVEGTALVGVPPSPPVWYGLGLGGIAVLLAVATFRLGAFETTAATQPLGRRAMLSGTDDLVVVVDGDDRVVELNRAARRALGVSADAVCGRSVEELLGADVAGLDRTRELELDTADGTRQYDVELVTLAESDRSLGHLVSLRDVTGRRRREQRLAVLNRVLRHNLNNDASVIVNYAEHVEERVDDETLAEAAASTAAKARKLVDHGQKARRIEAAMTDPTERTAVDLVDAVETALADLEPRYPEATVERDLPETGRALALPAVEYAVANVCENALEHNRGDEPQVTVGLERSDGAVTLVVADDGPGIPDHEVRALDAGEETPLEHGSGVGLWLVHWVVDRSGGDLSFDRPDEGGTVVRITLEAAVDAASADASGADRADDAEADPDTERSDARNDRGESVDATD